MEILKIIWTTLTTENAQLTNILMIPLIFIEVTVIILLLTTILNIKSTKKQKILFVLIYSISSILSNFIIPSPFNTFLNLILNPILILVIFKTSILKTFVGLILQYFIFVILGTILLNVYTIIFNIPTTNLAITPIYKMTASLLQYLLIYLFCRYCKKYNINIHLLDNINRKTNIILVIHLVVGIVAIAIQSYIVATLNDSIPFIVTLASLLILVGYFFLNLYSLSRATKLEITTRSLEEKENLNKTLTSMYDNISAFRHDFNNIVQAIGGYVSNEDMNGLKKYYTQLVGDCQRVNDMKILSPGVINNPAIYSLFTSKYNIAEEKGITLTYNIHLDLNTLNMKIYEFTRIMGILIDNAIEAASMNSEKVINIHIQNDSKIARQLVVVENSYANKDVDTTKIFEKGFSSKKEDKAKHGLGLWEVNKILNRNNNLSLFTSKDDIFFKQQLEIYL